MRDNLDETVISLDVQAAHDGLGHPVEEFVAVNWSIKYVDRNAAGDLPMTSEPDG